MSNANFDTNKTSFSRKKSARDQIKAESSARDEDDSIGFALLNLYSLQVNMSEARLFSTSFVRSKRRKAKRKRQNAKINTHTQQQMHDKLRAAAATLFAWKLAKEAACVRLVSASSACCCANSTSTAELFITFFRSDATRTRRGEHSRRRQDYSPASVSTADLGLLFFSLRVSPSAPATLFQLTRSAAACRARHSSRTWRRDRNTQGDASRCGDSQNQPKLIFAKLIAAKNERRRVEQTDAR